MYERRTGENYCLNKNFAARGKSPPALSPAGIGGNSALSNLSNDTLEYI
jgi:hypothetical protein